MGQTSKNEARNALSPEQQRKLAERTIRKEEKNRHAIRMSDAVQRILEVAVELHLTWGEFEEVLRDLKNFAYIGSKPSAVSERGHTP